MKTCLRGKFSLECEQTAVFTKLGKLFCWIVMATLFFYVAIFQLLLLWKSLIVEGKQLFSCIKSTVCEACRLFAKKNKFYWSESGRRVERRSLLINLAHIFWHFSYNRWEYCSLGHLFIWIVGWILTRHLFPTISIEKFDLIRFLHHGRWT